MMATQSGSSLTGILMLFCFSIGLGIPFIISALLIERLKTTFDVIKKNYKTIHLVSGIFLVAIGVLMATGALGKYLSWITG
jgi:cytochrome c-type biogenesis protein